MGYIFKHITAVVAMIAATIIAMVSGAGVSYAATSNYSDALTDLQIDTQFNEKEYPANDKDYSIKLIQIAESVDGELFVYTYQPCQKTKYLIATDVNMSLSETADGTRLYDLELIDSSGVFCKYKVESVKVSSAKERYYSITSIYRDFISGIDKKTDNDNITNRIAFAVGQRWRATTQGDTVKYKMFEVETVEIKNPFTSYIRRNKNQSVNDFFQDNYFVAFSTDRNINELLSATVEYRIQDYFYKENNVFGFEDTEFWSKSTFSNEKRMHKDVYCDEVNELQQDGFNLFGIFDLNKQFSWKRIQSSSDFINNAGATDKDNNEVKNLQWVLMFDETSVYRYQSGGLIARYEETGQVIDEVTILRLEFVEDGITYNLGAVSDTISKDHDFSDKTDGATIGDKKKGFFVYVWDCLVKLFTGKAGVIETIVAVVAIVVAVVVFVLAVKLLRWVIKGLFGGGKE